MDILSTAILLFLIMDPLGNMPIFISVLKTVPDKRRNKVLVRELLISLVLLIAFLFAGDAMLSMLHLRQESVSITGAIILFLIAIKMIFPPGRGGGNIMGDTPDGEPFIVPLSIPLIAGPSIMAALILLNHQHPEEQNSLIIALLIAWVVSSAILMGANKLMKVMGNRGIYAIERLMGMILVMISVQMFMDGIANYLN